MPTYPELHREGYLITVNNKVYEIATPYIFSQENWNRNVRETNPPFCKPNVVTHEDMYVVIRNPRFRRPNINIDDGWNLESWEKRFAIWDSRWEGEWTDWLDFLSELPYWVEVQTLTTDGDKEPVTTHNELSDYAEMRDDMDNYYSIQFLLTLWSAHIDGKPVMDDIMNSYLTWLGTGAETPDMFTWPPENEDDIVVWEQEGRKYSPIEMLTLPIVTPHKLNLPILNYAAPEETRKRLIFRKYHDLPTIWEADYRATEHPLGPEKRNDIMSELMGKEIMGNIFVEVPYITKENIAESGIGSNKLLEMQEEINQFRDLIFAYATNTAYLLNFPFGISTPIV